VALAIADRLLQAWNGADVENGMALLSNRAKEKTTADDLRTFFSNTDACAFEIGRGKQSGPSSYEFPVTLFTSPEHNAPVRRRISSIVVSRTGNNDWVIDKLP
jgi:hypothetical protein